MAGLTAYRTIQPCPSDLVYAAGALLIDTYEMPSKTFR